MMLSIPLLRYCHWTTTQSTGRSWSVGVTQGTLCITFCVQVDYSGQCVRGSLQQTGELPRVNPPKNLFHVPQEDSNLAESMLYTEMIEVSFTTAFVSCMDFICFILRTMLMACFLQQTGWNSLECETVENLYQVGNANPVPAV